MRCIVNKNWLICFTFFGSVISSLFIIGIVPTFLESKVYPQNTTGYPFENATHIQYNIGEDIFQKLPLRLFIDLTRDSEGYAFSGDPYKFVYNGLQLDINDNGKLKSYWYNLTNSGTNQVSISDTQIYPSFTFRMPIGPNSTTQSVQEISQVFKVGQISPLPDGTEYLSNYGSPITVNNTTYEYPFLIVNQYNNGTAKVILVSDEPGQNL
jgi:hypothetical protein